MHVRGSGFCRDEAGVTAILTGLLFSVLCLSVGLAIDYSRSLHTQTGLQEAADAASLAGAAAIDATDNVRIATAKKVYYQNVDLTPPPVPVVTIIGGAVRVVADTNVATTFMAIGGMDTVRVRVLSEASAYVSPLPCILTLEETEFGLQANSDSNLNASCGIQVNSGHSEALYADSNSHVTGTMVKVRGSVIENSGSSVTPAAVEGATRVPDPLASLPEPPQSSLPCDHTDYTVNSGGLASITPGVYCKTTLIDSNATAVMQPGVYVFKEGEFNINSLSSVTGNGVMLFFADKDARLNVNSDSDLEISAPTSGPYAGILMFQSRDSETLNAAPFIINSDSTTKLEGTIYLANGKLELNSQSSSNSGAAYTAVIVNQMVLNSAGNFVVNSDYTGNTPLPSLLSGITGSKLARMTR